MEQSLYYIIITALTRRQQVLLLSPIHLLLIVIVPILFILAFSASFASTAPKKALWKLKQYLASKNQEDLTAISTKEAVVRLEKRFNQVKILCTPEALRRDPELKALLQSLLKKIHLQAGTGAHYPISIHMIEALIKDFYITYSPATVPEHIHYATPPQTVTPSTSYANKYTG